MSTFSYDLMEDAQPKLGLIVLQSDETLERDLRLLLPASHKLLVSRMPATVAVTPEDLAAMEAHLTASAALFPVGMKLDVVGYGCTSGTAQIGAGRIAELTRRGKHARAVTEPVSALVAACRALGVGRLALLSPYVETVSDRLREVLGAAGVQTPIFGTFAEPEETKVAKIAPGSLASAARALVADGGVNGLFLSCTNLRTLDVIGPLEAELKMPVLSSNLVLAWHMLVLAGADDLGAPADLLRTVPAA